MYGESRYICVCVYDYAQYVCMILRTYVFVMQLICNNLPKTAALLTATCRIYKPHTHACNHRSRSLFTVHVYKQIHPKPPAVLRTYAEVNCKSNFTFLTSSNCGWLPATWLLYWWTGGRSDRWSAGRYRLHFVFTLILAVTERFCLVADYAELLLLLLLFLLFSELELLLMLHATFQ